MKAITFLGAGKAHETTYSLDNREHTANYFGVALARFYPGLDNMKVFVTAEAREKHWEDFKRQAEDFVDPLEAVDIPNGADTDQLWLLFQTVVDAVDEGEEVIFDITHGFRTLPFLSLLAVAYLRQVKDIQMGAVLYGNYEARDGSNRAPVIDLSGFVSLFDWMTAADRFIRFGDASDLAERLREVKPDRNQPQNSLDQIARFLAGEQGDRKPLQDQPASSLPPVITADMLRKPTAERKATAAYPAQSQQANRLARVANSLERVSKSLRLIRPNEAMSASASLCTILSDHIVLDSIKANARPFALLTESIRHEYEQLSLSDRQQREQPTLGLKRERDMVNWLLERKQYAQAVSIAREWLISWAWDRMGGHAYSDGYGRRDAERALKGDIAYHHIDQIRDAQTLYSDVAKVRNDLLHAGKNPDALRAHYMENEVTRVCARLSELQLPD